MLDEDIETTFPLEALPPVLKGVVEHIQSKNQTPVEMCACSVLAASALACQGLADVNWREDTISPLSLTFILEANSGERKTSNDAIAFKEIYKFDEKQAALSRTDGETHERAMQLWELRVKAIKKSILKTDSSADNFNHLSAALETVLKSKPVRPKRARMILSNITRQALARHLGAIYPYAGLVSDEGGIVISSDALGDPAMLNKLSDGGTWSSSRISREEVELRDTRLSIYLQIQPEIFADFLVRRGNIIHGSGFSSRWLYACPKPRAGKRTKRSVDHPSADDFHAAVRGLLASHESELPPARRVLHFTDAAMERLSRFGELIELELGKDGRYSQMSGHAAKGVEKCARLAGVMHLVEGGSADISADTTTRAVKLTAWFMEQYRQRFFPLTRREQDMEDLEKMLMNLPAKYAAAREISGPDLCRRAPLRIRPVKKLWPVLAALQAKGILAVYRSTMTRKWRVVLTDWTPAQMAVADPIELDPDFPPLPVRHIARSTNGIHPQPEQPLATGYELWPGTLIPF